MECLFRGFDDFFWGFRGTPWTVYEKQVRKLQFRIAKAFLEGRTGKMNILQRLLTRSLAAKRWPSDG
jgi:hypothetical protein